MPRCMAVAGWATWAEWKPRRWPRMADIMRSRFSSRRFPRCFSNPGGVEVASPRKKKAEPQEFTADCRARAVIEDIVPRVDDGRFAVKLIDGDGVEVDADCFGDGHGVRAGLLRY